MRTWSHPPQRPQRQCLGIAICDTGASVLLTIIGEVCGKHRRREFASYFVTIFASLQILARCTHRSAEQGPHVWGSDPGGAHGFDFVAVRLHSAPRTHPRKRGPCSTLRRIPAPRYAESLLHTAPNPCSALRGRTSLRFGPRLRPQRELFLSERKFDH